MQLRGIRINLARLLLASFAVISAAHGEEKSSLRYGSTPLRQNVEAKRNNIYDSRTNSRCNPYSRRCDAWGSKKNKAPKKNGAPAKCTATPTVTATPRVTYTVRPSPTPKPPATPTATPTPTPTVPKKTLLVCRIPNGNYSAAQTVSIYEDELKSGDVAGACPLDCMGIPFGRAALDICGVCGGDNATCKDCAGVPNGGKRIDACGVCGGDGKSCLGCDGAANSGKVVDVCGLCGGDNSACKDCNGIPNGGSVIDACGVCGGDNSTCRDCAGVVNGASKVNACGVCGTDGVCTESCKGVLDACGVCNGNNACVDCAGVPNGGAKVDCCGVCGGDGSSCAAKCKYYDLAALKKELVKTYKNLYRLTEKYTARQLKCDPKNKSAAARMVLARKLIEQNTTLTGLIGDRLKLCLTVFCKKSSYLQVKNSIQRNTARLYNLSAAAQYGAGDACGHVPPKKNEGRTTRKLFESARVGISSIPSTHCLN